MARPMSASQLVAALKAEGVEVEEVRSWRTHNRNHKGAWGPVNGVLNHHTVTRGTSATVDLCYRGHSALPGPLCHGVIAKSGVVYLVGNGRANHAGFGDPDVLDAVISEEYGDYPPSDNQASVDGNSRFYGYEAENMGDGKDPWPRVQYVAMVKANAAICRHHGWSAKSAIAHKEWQPGKVDPRGIDMKDFRRDLAACLKQKPGAWPGTEEDDMAISDADVQRIVSAFWNWDGVDPLHPTKSNPHHQPENVLTSIWEAIDRTEKKVDALAAKVDGQLKR